MALDSMLSSSAPVFLEGQWKLETLESSEKQGTREQEEARGCWLPLSGAGSRGHYLGDQNVPLQNTPLWHKDYFELKTIEKQQMPKKALCPLLFA